MGLGFTNPVGPGGVWDMCLCLDCSGVGRVVGWPGSGRVNSCCLCVL